MSYNTLTNICASILFITYLFYLFAPYAFVKTDRNAQRGHVPISNQQVEPGPIQSKSFRVLQKITDTDPDQIDEEHLRKLQLTEDDRYLMNKFKEQGKQADLLRRFE
jgi:cell fate regulator YaaT (PSP1 superfamily)